MISNKGRGSLEKSQGRTGTRGFWPLDPDLRVLVGSVQDLIQAVAYGSGGQERLGFNPRGETAARYRRRGIPRRRAGEPAGEGLGGALGLGLGRGLAGGVASGMRSPLGG